MGTSIDYFDDLISVQFSNCDDGISGSIKYWEYPEDTLETFVFQLIKCNSQNRKNLTDKMQKEFSMDDLSKERIEKNLEDIQVQLDYLNILKSIAQRDYVDSFDMLFEEAEKELFGKKEEYTKSLKAFDDVKIP